MLTGSETVQRDADDIPVFASEEEGDDHEPIFSSEFAFVSDHPDFIEVEYDHVDHLLAMQEGTYRELHFNQITLHELASAQLNDKFCSKIYRRLNVWRDSLFALTTITGSSSEMYNLTLR